VSTSTTIIHPLEAPADECLPSRALIAADDRSCREYEQELSLQNHCMHEVRACDAGILTGRVTRSEHEADEVTYHVHRKKHDPASTLTMRDKDQNAVGIGDPEACPASAPALGGFDIPEEEIPF